MGFVFRLTVQTARRRHEAKAVARFDDCHPVRANVRAYVFSIFLSTEVYLICILLSLSKLPVDISVDMLLPPCQQGFGNRLFPLAVCCPGLSGCWG